MTRLFYGFLALGMALTIALAAVFPLPENQRYRSTIGVIPDGGREETYVIQWPQDRIQPLAATATGLVVAGGAVLLPSDGAPGTSAEVFRLRDVAGNVIGLASRSTSLRSAESGAASQGSDWVVLLPSRGALFMTQTNSRDVAPRAPAAGGPPAPAPDDAAFWAAETRLKISAGPTAEGAGQVIGGTGEFNGLRGSYDETWELEEVGADGVTRGRITLDTRVLAAQ